MATRSFQDCHGMLVDALSIKGKLDSVLSHFEPQVTSEEKLRYLWGLEEFQEAFNICSRFEDKKDEEKARQYRLKGNEFYAERKFSEALAQYTKCIMNSESNGSGNLALAYGNRSAILFELHQYKKCLRDIDRAMNSGYPEDKIAKLTERYSKCLTALDKEHGISDAMKNVNIHDETQSEDNIQAILNADKITSPTLVEANPKIPALTSAAEIGYSEERGRFLYATRDIFPGEVLIRERSFACIPKNVEDFCSNCLRPSLTPVPCPHCTMAIFCDRDCISEAASFHSVECGLLKTISFPNDSVNLLNQVLRCIATVPFSSLKTQWASCEVEERTNQPGKMGHNEDGAYVSDDYRTIYHLKTLEESRLSRVSFLYVCISLHMLKLLGLDNAYVDKALIPNSFEVLKDDALLLAKAIFRYLCNFSSNSYHCFMPAIREHGQMRFKGSSGAGIYSVAALMNHSCSPSAGRFCCWGSVLVVGAIRFIPKGNEITTIYNVKPYYAEDGPTRRSSLLRVYHFECRCDACVNDWPVMSELPQKLILQCPKCKIQLNMESGCPKCELNAFTLPSTISREERIVAAQELNEIIEQSLRESSNRRQINIKSYIKTACNALTLLNLYVKPPTRDEALLLKKLEVIFVCFGFSPLM